MMWTLLFLVAWGVTVSTLGLVQAVRRARADDDAVGLAVGRTSLRIAASAALSLPDLWLVGMAVVTTVLFGLA